MCYTYHFIAPFLLTTLNLSRTLPIFSLTPLDITDSSPNSSDYSPIIYPSCCGLLRTLLRTAAQYCASAAHFCAVTADYCGLLRTPMPPSSYRLFPHYL